MQVFGNVATQPERLTTKSNGRVYWQMRVAESHRGLDGEPPTWYTVRVMRETIPELNKGDFVKITGKLKTDFYLSREGKPTGTLLILAFEAAKIAKPAKEAAASSTRTTPEEREPRPTVSSSGAGDWQD